MNKHQSYLQANASKFVQANASKSDGYISFIVILFSLLGVVTAIIPLSPFSVGLLFGLWFPLCCAIFVGIHSLCHEVLELKQKLEKLEKDLTS